MVALLRFLSYFWSVDIVEVTARFSSLGIWTFHSSSDFEHLWKTRSLSTNTRISMHWIAWSPLICSACHWWFVVNTSTLTQVLLPYAVVGHTFSLPWFLLEWILRFTSVKKIEFNVEKSSSLEKVSVPMISTSDDFLKLGADVFGNLGWENRI